MTNKTKPTFRHLPPEVRAQNVILAVLLHRMGIRWLGSIEGAKEFLSDLTNALAKDKNYRGVLVAQDVKRALEELEAKSMP